MVKCLLDEEEEEGGLVPRGGATIPKDDSIQIVMVSQLSFPGHLESTNMPMGSSADNPVTLSDVPTDASTPGACPEDTGIEDEAKILGHYSDALNEMAQCITDLES